MSAAALETENALELMGVSRNFGGLKAVDQVSMTVKRGTTHVIIGPNGAGKTTLFALISGELTLDSGQVKLFGQDVSHWSATRRSQNGMGRTYQITNIFADLTVEQNVMLAIRGRHGERFSLIKRDQPEAAMRERIAEILGRSGLEGRQRMRAGDLSYGEQRLLELSIAIGNEPRILLLDEPAAGLSPAERGPMAETIRSLAQNLTVVLIEHDMALALGLADRVTCLYYGALLAEGTPDEIRANDQVQTVYFGRPGSDA
ncbi:Branched-chain amino acid transport system ATP-binding protein OS=Castellaniella defragrans OX=75697 GN=HNR28_002212 PE=4 SV=1 [Castellaniella defragrans]